MEQKGKIKALTPHDLRIGNWVRFNGRKSFEVQLVQRRSVAIGTEDNNFSASYDEIRPVPLTDGIMKRCGFRYIKYYGVWYKEKPRIEVLLKNDGHEGKARIDCVEYMASPTIYCRSLHELQNCYFAVTGEELGIKY